MEFKSQICTTKEQSERLLKLGLKKETADMVHQSIGATPYNVWYKTEIVQDFIPAWSLNRLLEIGFPKGIGFVVANNAFDNIISLIERRINNEVFNKEYLEN